MLESVSQDTRKAFEEWERSKKRLNGNSSPAVHRKVRLQADRVAKLALEEILQKLVPDSGTRSLLKQHASDWQEIIGRLDKNY